MPDRPSCPRRFEVVFVCTGNRARSPLAEALFRKYADGLETTVSSVGTIDVGPAPALREGVVAARSFGVDLENHRARTLRAGSLRESDLVIGFEPAHLSTAVVEGAAHSSRTFLLGELVHLLDTADLDSDPCSRARQAVARADSRRVRSRPDRTRGIPDPYGKSAKVMHRTAYEIDGLVRRLVAELFGLEHLPARGDRPRRWRPR